MAKAAAQPAAARGQERIAAAFERARDEGRAALMPYMMGAFPDRDGAESIAAAYSESGADLIELGIPFSDPLADGPVIHGAATRALEGGATLESALGACSAVADSIPVVVMCYANMAFAVSLEIFAGQLVEAGAAGAIVPDLPLEESEQLHEALRSKGLASIPLIAPTTPPERRRRICAAAEGFVYVVSTTGTTGERDQLPPELAKLVESVRAEAEAPAAVGFGISTPEQAAAVGEIADGVIIGSRLVRLASESGEAAVREFLTEVRDRLSAGGAGIAAASG